MSEKPTWPDLLICPKCRFRTPSFWYCQRTSRRDRQDTYSLWGCDHASEVGEWHFPPHGFSTDRKALAEAWNEWATENSPQQPTPSCTNP